MKTRNPLKHLFPLFIVLAIAIGLRVFLLALGSVSFDGDEAVVGLMARHILQGERPIFFYGQSYMGSLDATLNAIAFGIFGESVLTMRLVQSILYIGIVGTTYLLGKRLFKSLWIALTSALLLAIPTVLVTTYTTISLGGYGEILLLGNVILLVTHSIIDGNSSSRSWLVLGICSGLGFWTLALISVYVIPSAMLILWSIFSRNGSLSDKPRTMLFRRIALAILAFFICSTPWWWHNLTNGWSALTFFFNGFEGSRLASQVLPFHTRLLGLVLIGFGSILGLKAPWSPTYHLLPLSAIALAVYGILFVTSIKFVASKFRRSFLLLVGVFLTMLLIFVASQFGFDATGRYLLPLAVPLALSTAALAHEFRSKIPKAPNFIIAFLLLYHLTGNLLAALNTSPGITAQLDPINRLDKRYDQELVNFLEENDLYFGFSNYWVSMRTAFVSQERIILSPQLPCRLDLVYNSADDRYPLYTETVEKSDKPFYITSNNENLDQTLARRLRELGVEFDEKQIGPYHLFFNLSRKVIPSEIGIGL